MIEDPAERRTLDDIDFQKYFAALLRRWYWIVLGTVAGFAVAWLVNRYSDPMFSVSATMIINTSGKGGGFSRDDNMIESLELMGKAKSLDTEKAILRSYSLNQKVIRKLDFDVTYIGIGRVRDPEIYPNNYFRLTADTAFRQRVDAPVDIAVMPDGRLQLRLPDGGPTLVRADGERVDTLGFRFRVDILADLSQGVPYSRFVAVFNSAHRLVNTYRTRLRVASDDDVSVIRLSSVGPVPAKEIAYLDMLTRTYIEQDLAEKSQIATSAMRFIERQLADITDSLADAETQLQNFKMENGVVDINRESSALYSRYQELQSEKSRELVRRRYLEHLAATLESRRDGTVLVTPGIAGINDPILSSTITQINAAKAELQSQSFLSLKETTQTQLTERRIASLEDGLALNVSTMLEQNSILLADVDARLHSLEADMQRLPLNERRMLAINRRFTLNNDIYTYLLEKHAETGIKRASIQSDGRVLDSASQNRISKVSPQESRNTTMFTLLGMVLPVLAILALEVLNNRVRNRRDVESRTRIPIIGTIGHNTTGLELVTYKKPRSSITESFRTIKTNLQFALTEGDCLTVLVSSAVSGEGKSFCSMNLACTYAGLGKRTALLGMDLRRPRLHKVFGLSNRVGITNYLADRVGLEEIIVPSGVPGLDLLPSGPSPHNPNQLMESVRFHDLVATLKDRYEVLIIDSPPVGIVSDALYLSRFCDTTIFVLRVDYTTHHACALLNEIAENHRAANLCIALNDMDHGSYYGYGRYGNYGYGRYYGKYYDEEHRGRRRRLGRKKADDEA